MTNLDSVLKSRDITLWTKVHILKAMVFPLVTYRCEKWPLKKTGCQRIAAFKPRCWRRLLEVLRNKIKPANLKGDQPWIFTERTDAEAEAPIIWSSDALRWLIGKILDAGKDWGQKVKRVPEDEMAGWHHQCNGHELGQTLGGGEGQGRLLCYSPWYHKKLDMAGQLSNNNNRGELSLLDNGSLSKTYLSCLMIRNYNIFQ